MSVEFIDSNVFIYLFDETAPEKQRAAEELILPSLESGSACISFQVVQETLNVVTRKLRAPMPPADARRFLDSVLIPLWRVMPTQALYHRALDLRTRYQYGFYDALIIAAALEAGCSILYSEDLQHGQRIEGLTIKNPFAG
ncbi:MAG: PIN domain-containing protein [Candidatus Hydrogenedentes bacterium]|nr:PIN domain-containing protein [Candidatus Hydrogenedentota bacterium]